MYVIKTTTTTTVQSSDAGNGKALVISGASSAGAHCAPVHKNCFLYKDIAIA